MANAKAILKQTSPLVYRPKTHTHSLSREGRVMEGGATLATPLGQCPRKKKKKRMRERERERDTERARHEESETRREKERERETHTHTQSESERHTQRPGVLGARVSGFYLCLRLSHLSKRSPALEMHAATKMKH